MNEHMKYFDRALESFSNPLIGIKMAEGNYFFKIRARIVFFRFFSAVSVKNYVKNCNFCPYIVKQVIITRKNIKTAENYRENRFLTENWCFFDDMQIGNGATPKYIFLSIFPENFSPTGVAAFGILIFQEKLVYWIFEAWLAS